MNLTKIQDMYRSARIEVADVLSAPWVLDVPIDFDHNLVGGAIAVTNFESLWDTLFNDNPARPFKNQPAPKGIVYNLDILPYMDEDEVLYGLLHELTHAALPYDVQHGWDFVNAVVHTTGVQAPWVGIRDWTLFGDNGFGTLDDPPSLDVFPWLFEEGDVFVAV